MLRDLRRFPLPLMVGALLVMSFVVFGLTSIVWTPHDPTSIGVYERLAPPGSEGYLLGTDRAGRDVLSILMAGALNGLVVSVVSTVGALVVGVAVGLAAAGSGPLLGGLLRRVTDIGIALPAILVALVVAALIGPGHDAVIIAIIISFIPWAARITIGPAQQVLAREYVQAAFGYGRSRRYVLIRHVVPNIASVMIVQATMMVAAAIMAEASLAFLGVGAPPPAQSWGRLLSESQNVAGSAPTLVLIPGIGITLTVLGFNLLGNGLHALIDPRQRVKRVKAVVA